MKKKGVNMKKILLFTIITTTLTVGNYISAENVSDAQRLQKYANFNTSSTAQGSSSAITNALTTIDGWVVTAAEQYPFLKPYADKLHLKIQEYLNNPQTGISDLQTGKTGTTSSSLTPTSNLTPTSQEELDVVEVGP